MLLAQVFDDGEIGAAFGSIKTFADLRQWEAAGMADLSDGIHAGRTGWSNIPTKSRTERGRQDWRRSNRALLIAIIGTRLAGRWKLVKGGEALSLPSGGMADTVLYVRQHPRL